MKRDRFKDPETEKEPDHKDIEAETHKKRQKDGKRDIERGTDMGGDKRESEKERQRWRMTGKQREREQEEIARDRKIEAETKRKRGWKQ